MGKPHPFLEERQCKVRLVFRCFLHGLKAGLACLQTQINPAKSRVLLFDAHYKVLGLLDTFSLLSELP
jgi:hypothetical protein